MGGPADLNKVNAPWDPAQALKRWQDEGMRKVKEAGDKAPASQGTGTGAGHASDHPHFTHYGVEWPGAVLEYLWNNEDSTAVNVVKFPFLLLSPILIGPLALLGHMFDEINFYTGGTVDAGGPVDGVLRPVFRNIDLDALNGLLNRSQVPDQSDARGSDAHRSHDTKVAYETVPPIPATPIRETPRERNKCSAASRGARK